VIDSRPSDSVNVSKNFVTLKEYVGRYTQEWVYRRRRCECCSMTFSTVELSVEDLQTGWEHKY